MKTRQIFTLIKFNTLAMEKKKIKILIFFVALMTIEYDVKSIVLKCK